VTRQSNLEERKVRALERIADALEGNQKGATMVVQKPATMVDGQAKPVPKIDEQVTPSTEPEIESDEVQGMSDED
jgi:hypothetical protein